MFSQRSIWKRSVILIKFHGKEATGSYIREAEKVYDLFIALDAGDKQRLGAICKVF